jgi:hypothetical protein
MAKGFRLALVGIALAALAPPLGAQDGAVGPDLTVLPPVPKDYVPAKTPWGEPDFRGGWPIDHLQGLPLQRPEEMGDRVFLNAEELAAREARVENITQRYAEEDSNDKMGMGHWLEVGEASARTSLIVLPANGRLPEMTEEGKRRQALMRSSWRRGQSFDWVDDFDSWDRCITRGLPVTMMPMMYNNGIRIFQAPGLVAIQTEMIHEVRIVYTDGRPTLPGTMQNWLGESRGHWEDGNTLVIETTNFRPGPSATNISTTASPPFNDTPTSEQARLTERLTMTGPDSIVYETVWNDPVVFTEPWGTRLDWQRNDGYEFFEYACHEGNVQVRNYITASRAQRAGQTAED